jgi:hypothetical protein
MQRAKLYRFFIALMCLTFLAVFILPDQADARGGSFGGSRGGGSFGGGRSFGGSRSFGNSGSGSSFGGSRSGSSGLSGRSMGTVTRSTPSGLSSFGGRRLGSSGDYTARYGAPRATMPAQQLNSSMPANYMVHDYGGFGSGMMMGYMMGQSSWMWSMPFSRQFYYSKPYYVENADGSVDVYPPTFSFGKLIFTLLILGAIGYIIYVIIRNRRRGGYVQHTPHGSFG